VSGPTIRVQVSTRAAILAGKSRVGTQTIEITEAGLASLDEVQRAEIAALLEGDSDLGSLPTDPPIIEPTLEAVRHVLDARAAGRKALEATRRVEEARAAEAAVVASRESKAKDVQRTQALRSWINKNGDEEQKARMAEGFLREDEILESIIDDMFDIQLPRYELLRRGDACDCACAGNVQFEERGPKYMDSAQYGRLTAARESAPEGATVAAIEHRAACPSCKCVPIARVTARVSVPWNSWLLVRDYSLD
jgi:hypothetical protein